MHMRSIALIAVIFISATRMLGGEIIHTDRSWFTHFTNKICEFKVKDSDVVKTSVWTEASENPALSSRRAIHLSKPVLAALVTTPTDWKLDAVSLEPWDDDGHWIYLITFRHNTTSHSDGSIFEIRTTSTRPATISIPVLLSGIAIEPIISLPKKKE